MAKLKWEKVQYDRIKVAWNLGCQGEEDYALIERTTKREQKQGQKKYRGWVSTDNDYQWFDTLNEAKKILRVQLALDRTEAA
jgi:hypothetical protein